MNDRTEHDDDGYTLMELIVSMGIMSIVMIAVLGATIQVYSAVNRTEGTSFARDQVGASFRRLDKELRYANWVSVPGQVGSAWYLEFSLPTGCRQLVYDGGKLTLASWTAPGAPGTPAVIASELSLIPGVKPFQLYAPGDTPYASMSPGTAGVGTKYTAEFDQVRLRFNAVYGDVTLPFDTLFTAENTNRNTSDDNPCRSGRPT